MAARRLIPSLRTREVVEPLSPAHKGTHGTHVFAGPFPAAEVAQLAKAASAAGEAVVLILQKSRLSSMRRRLRSTPRCSFAETHAVLEAMTVDGRLDKQKVIDVVGGAVAAAAKTGNGLVNVFTDAAGTLVLMDRFADSRVLEQLCHGVCRTSPVFLTCVYPVDAFSRLGTSQQAFRTEHHLHA